MTFLFSFLQWSFTFILIISPPGSLFRFLPDELDFTVISSIAYCISFCDIYYISPLCLLESSLQLQGIFWSQNPVEPLDGLLVENRDLCFWLEQLGGHHFLRREYNIMECYLEHPMKLAVFLFSIRTHSLHPSQPFLQLMSPLSSYCSQYLSICLVNICRMNM